jgi:glycosyltransferase 2 family protein
VTAARPSRGWRKPLSTILKIAFSCGLIAWVLHKTNLHSIGQSLLSANPAWLALALALGIAGTLVQAKQWQRLLIAVGLNRTIARCLRIVFVGNTFNAILPSSIGGDASRAVYIAERPGERAPGAAAVALQRLLNFPGMVLLMGIGLVLTATSDYAARVRPVALVGAALGLAIVGITVSPLIGRFAASTRLARLPGWKPLSTSLQVLDGFRSQRAELAAATARGALFWSLTVLNQWAYIRAMGIHPSLGYTALAVTLVNLATMLPLSINGFGAREGGYIALLAGTKLATTAQAASVGLLISGQSLLFGLIGAGCLLTMRSTAPWARRVEVATMTVVTPLYAAAAWLSPRTLLMTFGISSRPGEGAPQYDKAQVSPVGASRAEQSPLPDEIRG